MRTIVMQPVAAVLLVAGLALVSANRAAAEPIAWPETGTPGYLTIATDPGIIRFPAMSPGTTGYAAVDLRLADAQWADASVVLETDGALMAHPAGAVLGLRACDRPWTGLPDGAVAWDAAGPTCTTGARTLLEPTPGSAFLPAGPDAGAVWPVGLLRSRTPDHLMLSLALPTAGAADETLQGLAGDFLLRFTAEGDQSVVLPEDPQPGSGEPDPAAPAAGGQVIDTDGRAGAGVGGGVLATTGAALLGWLLAGTGATALGAVALVARRRAAA